jgi:hypothetical protein
MKQLCLTNAQEHVNDYSFTRLLVNSFTRRLVNSSLLLVFLTGIAGNFFSCQTDGEYADWTGSGTPVRAEFKYLADPEARFAVEYAGMEIADTIPYNGQYLGRQIVNLSESQMSGLLRIYRLENGERILETEEQIRIAPLVITGDARYVYAAITLVQLAAGSPVQALSIPETPADSSAIALQFFYADERQPGEVRVSLLAVDQYSLIVKSYKLDNVPDTMKAEAGEIVLRRGEVSETVVLNLNHFGEANKGLAAKFYYRVYDADGNLLQDYKAASSVAKAAEIKFEAVTKNKIPYPVYKSTVMQWEFQAEDTPFASPKTILNGDKW